MEALSSHMDPMGTHMEPLSRHMEPQCPCKGLGGADPQGCDENYSNRPDANHLCPKLQLYTADSVWLQSAERF